MESLLKQTVDALSALGSGVTWNAMLALTAAGTISMAVLQVIKELTPFRRNYQRRWFERWIDARANDFEKTAQNAKQSARPASEIKVAAKAEVVGLATGGLADALYDLYSEDMVAQINLAAQVTLDAPKRYEALLSVLSEGTLPNDLTVIMAGQPKNGSTQDYFDARNRVSRRIQRNLDGVRIALSNRWKFWMQVISVALTAGVVEIAVWVGTDGSWSACGLALPIGIIGGYLAPITRDLLAALQKLRN